MLLRPPCRKNIPTIVEFFGVDLARRLISEGKRADLIIGNNVLAQVPDLNDFVGGMAILLGPNGVITLEFPHLEHLIDENQFDTIYHEHFSYFSFVTIDRLAKHHALKVFDVEHLTTHGGSLRVYLCHAGAPYVPSPAVAALLAHERRIGFEDIKHLCKFFSTGSSHKAPTPVVLNQTQREGREAVWVWRARQGRTHCSTTAASAPTFLDFTVDRNPYKHGRYTPGMHIPIYPVSAIDDARPDYLFILPWNLKQEIVEQMRHVGDWGCKFIVAIPQRGSDRSERIDVMKVVLFCGGLGTRIRDYSENIPKPMVPIGHHPILWHVMQYYSQYEHNEFILCLGYKANIVKNYFLNYKIAESSDCIISDFGSKVEIIGERPPDWRVTLVDTGIWRNIGERLFAVKRFVENEEIFLANYSDGLTDAPLAEMIARFKASGKIGCFLAVHPPVSFHLAEFDEHGTVQRIRSSQPIRCLDQWRLFYLSQGDF